MNNSKICLIGKGLSGWYASFRPVKESSDSYSSTCSSSSSSYDRGAEQLLKYAQEAEENCPVYDMSNADPNDIIKWSCKRPMVDVSLKDGDIDKFTRENKNFALQMCGPGGLSGGFDTLVAQSVLENDEELGSLDHISCKQYLDLLRKRVPGTRFGHVKTGRVIWEDGTVTEWPTATNSVPIDIRVTDGNSLDSAIKDGLVKANQSRCFARKEIENNCLDKDGKAVAGRKIDNGQLTGRKCWAYCGVGYAYEVLFNDGKYGWYTDLKLST